MALDGGQTKFVENLRTSHFNEDLSNETTFSQIHPARQYLYITSRTAPGETNNKHIARYGFDNNISTKERLSKFLSDPGPLVSNPAFLSGYYND
jgi:hypothetical protein